LIVTQRGLALQQPEVALHGESLPETGLPAEAAIAPSGPRSQIQVAFELDGAAMTASRVDLLHGIPADRYEARRGYGAEPAAFWSGLEASGLKV